MDHLSARSADGSESTSSQWELELQASVEKLNNLPFEPRESDTTENHVNNVNTNGGADVDKCFDPESSEKSLREGQMDRLRQFDLIQGWQSLAQTPINSFINRSKIAFKNSFSKSLTSSPINMGNFSFGKTKASDSQLVSDQSSSSIFNESESQPAVEKPNEDISEEPRLQEAEEKVVEESQKQRPNHLPVQTTHSLDSTPVRTAKPLSSSSSFASSFMNGLKKSSNNETDSKAKELPLLSFFQKSSTALMPPKDKSCSMINLNEKQNLTRLLDSSELGNIQAASIEKLANARNKLVGDS